MNGQAQPLPSKRIHANEIVHALTHDTDEPIYRLRNATIEGRLDLKHRVVKVAVDIQDCHFIGEVDLRYCEFMQMVNFSGCCFHQTFNSGDTQSSMSCYGVKNHRLFYPLLFFLIVGTLVFWQNGALVDAKSTQTQPQELSEASAGQRLFNRLGYTVDLFIPVVNLRIAEKWRPQGVGREFYAAIHIIAGWLLIPLLIASLSGVVKRQSVS